MSQTIRKTATATALAFVAALALSACEEEGPAEQLGEAVDETARDVGQAAEDAAD